MFTVIALLRSLLSARRLAKVPIVFTKEMRHRGAVRLYIEGRFSQDGEEEETILAAAAACCEHVALVGDSGSGELQVWVPPELGQHVEITSGGRAAYRSALHAYLLEHGATSLTTLGHAVPKHRFVGVGTLSSFVRRHAAVFVLEDGIVRLGQTITFVEPGGHQCSFQERTKHTVANIITGHAEARMAGTDSVRRLRLRRLVRVLSCSMSMYPVAQSSSTRLVRRRSCLMAAKVLRSMSKGASMDNLCRAGGEAWRLQEVLEMNMYVICMPVSRAGASSVGNTGELSSSRYFRAETAGRGRKDRASVRGLCALD